MQEGFLKRFVSTMKCSVCGQRYELSSIKVLGHLEDLWFLSVFCPACHTKGFVAAVIKEGRLPEVVTDLTEADFARLRGVGKVEVDDVLDMHNFLKEFEGDFRRLFS